MAPKDAPVLVAPPNECYLTEQRDLAYVIKVKDFGLGDYLGLLRWTLPHPKSPLNQRTFPSCVQRDLAKAAEEGSEKCKLLTFQMKGEGHNLRTGAAS